MSLKAAPVYCYSFLTCGWKRALFYCRDFGTWQVHLFQQADVSNQIGSVFTVSKWHFFCFPGTEFVGAAMKQEEAAEHFSPCESVLFQPSQALQTPAFRKETNLIFTPFPCATWLFLPQCHICIDSSID